MKSYFSIKKVNILVTFCVIVSLTTSVFSQDQPNIVFIMTDDQSSIPLRSSDNQNQSRPFGFNGDSKVHTPIIDGLASNGLVFNNAFVSSSIFSPSRYSILAGRYVRGGEGTSFLYNLPVGNFSRFANNIELEENKTNLPKQFQVAGYKTTLLTFPNRPYQEFTDVNVDLSVSTKNTSIIGKVLAGYQGWFNTPTDGSNRGWQHYKTASGAFEPGEVTVDFWPDMSEADADEKYATPFTHKDGSQANVFSSTNTKTVNRHFKWMNDYGIDGVFFQQFASNLRSNNPKGRANALVVFDNIIAGAKANNNRLVSVMYDLSGSNATGTMVNDIKEHWQEMAIKHGVNENTKEYVLTYQQKPVVAIWGVGFNRTDNYDLDDIEELINYFKNDGCAVLLGVPRSWRTPGQGDAVNDPQLLNIIKSADIVHPWTPGRYSNISGVDAHKNIITADKAWCDAEDLLYMPVVFPGFSWQNLKKSQESSSELNSIPRLKGNFLWRQFYNAIDAGSQTIYVAMFDEIDEGTCIFKVDHNPPSSAESQFTNYEGLPNDYYLWLTGKASEALRGEITLTSAQPAYPDLPDLTNYYVEEFGDDTNTGTSPGTAVSTVQKAYNLAKEGSAINISGAVIQNSKISIKKSINFIGTDYATILPDANKQGTDRLFHISKPNLTVTFSDITFKGNKESSINGGAINMNADSNLTFINSIFDDNSTGGSDKSGGGLYFSEGNVTITNSIFKNNLARGNGGAISGSGDGTLTITGSLFINNTAANINQTNGNGDKANGGAINIFGDGRKVLMSKNTFYNNEATFQGGGIYFGGLNASSNIENITVFGNKVNLTSAQTGRAGGIRIEGNRVFEIKNSLIYRNLLGDIVHPESDINIASGVQLNFINSLSGVSKGFGSDDTYNSSNIEAVLASSNLHFNETSGKVEYNEVPNGGDTPIDFGNDGNDAGAWNSMYVLSGEYHQISKDHFRVYYDKKLKNLKILTLASSSMNVRIYNINGSQVLLKNRMYAKDLIDISYLKRGVYILKATIKKKDFSRKFILY